jgi:hypothetical protein
MTYSAVQQPAGGGDLICKLSLAAAKNPFDRSSRPSLPCMLLLHYVYQFCRILCAIAVQQMNWTKSGSLLLAVRNYQFIPALTSSNH